MTVIHLYTIYFSARKKKRNKQTIRFKFFHFNSCFAFTNFDDVVELKITNHISLTHGYKCRMKQMKPVNIDFAKDDNVMTYKNLFWYVIKFNLFLFLLRFS